MSGTDRAKSERKLYEGLFVYRGDLRQAAYFARYLLKKGWHFDLWDKAIRWPTYMQQAAFTSALVMAYCRPFAHTRSSATLPLKLIQYKPNELQLHKKLKALRNSVYAHSEVELHNVRPLSLNGSATAIATMPMLKLSKDETELLLVMICRASQAIDAKLQALIASVDNET